MSVDDPTVDDAGPVRVELAILYGAGDRFFVGQDVTLVLMQPNGPDCDPSKFAAWLMATDHGEPLLTSR